MHPKLSGKTENAIEQVGVFNRVGGLVLQLCSIVFFVTLHLQ